MLRLIAHLFETAAARRSALCLVLGLCAVLAACVDEPPPRSFTEFMEDRFAREGTLVRCNADRTATANDLECINARRAAAALAAKDDAAQRESRDAQSEASLLAARQRQAARQEAERRAVVTAQTEEQAAYEALWEEQAREPAPSEPAPISVGDARGSVATFEPHVVTEPAASGSVAPLPSLDPIQLPDSAKPPLTSISLPRGAKPMVFEPSEPMLEEFVAPERLKVNN